MKRIALLLNALLLTAGAGMAQSLAFTNVSVVDVVEGRTMPGMNVVITGDRITGVGSADSLRLPPDARDVDAVGMYLIPGLWDMHVHLDDPELWHRHVPPEEKETLLTLLVAHGVVGVRDMGSGLNQLNDWRRRSEAGNLLAPRIVAAGPFLDGVPAMWPASIGLETAEEAMEAVHMLARRDGVDFLKVYQGLPREAYFAIAQEAERLGIPIAGHLPFSVTVEEAVKAGQRSFEHLDGLLHRCTVEAEALEEEVRAAADQMDPSPGAVRVYVGYDPRVVSGFDPKQCQSMMKTLADAHTWQVPTLALLKGLLLTADPLRSDPRFRYLPDAYASHWREERSLPPQEPREFVQAAVDIQIRLAGALHAAGVPLLAGSDMAALAYTFPGSSLHDELAMLVEAGLTSAEALRTATINPARYLGRQYELGTVEFGKLADLVLLDANPLEDISNVQRIRAVVLNGRLLDREALDALLRDAEDRVAKEDEQAESGN